MKLHSDTLTADDIDNAAYRASLAVQLDGTRPVAPIGVARCDQRGSRKRARSFDVILTGDATHRNNAGPNGGHDSRAASWDQWGLFLADLFNIDPSLTVPGVYVDAEHFHWATGNRYGVGYAGHPVRPGDVDRPFIVGDDYHRRHKWEFGLTVATGAYVCHRCENCEASTRRVLPGHTWEELS